MPDDNPTGLARIIPWLPLGALAVSLIATATAAQIQIGSNTKAIDSLEVELKEGLTSRVPTFLYDRFVSDTEDELEELAENIDTNEQVLEQVDRSSDQINSRIELEVERLRNQIEQSEREQDIKLDAILNKLESLEEGN